MRKVLLSVVCAILLLAAIGCHESKYYDIRLQTQARNEQRLDTLRRDLRLIMHDLDLIFGLDYSSLRSDYPTPNY